MPTKAIPPTDRRRRPSVVEPDLTRREAATLLGCAVGKVDELIASGLLESYKLGGGRRAGRRIRRDSIDRFRRGFVSPEAA